MLWKASRSDLQSSEKHFKERSNLLRLYTEKLNSSLFSKCFNLHLFCRKELKTLTFKDGGKMKHWRSTNTKHTCFRHFTYLMPCSCVWKINIFWLWGILSGFGILSLWNAFSISSFVGMLYDLCQPQLKWYASLMSQKKMMQPSRSLMSCLVVIIER